MARIGSLALGGVLALAACSSGDGGSATPGTGGGSAGTGGTTGAAGSGGTTGTAGSGGTTGVAGTVGSAGTGGSVGSAGSSGGAGTGGATGGGSGAGGRGGSASGGAGTGGGAAGASGTGGGAGAGGRGGSAGGGGAGGRGGSAGGAGSGGSGGATNCAGHAISFNTNVTGGSDPAMARVNVAANTDLPTGNANRTVEFWAYLPSAATWTADTNTMFFYGANARTNDGFGFDFGTTAGGIGTIDPFTNGSTDPMGDNKSSGLMASTPQWAHFAMTWDGTNLRAFVNGVEKVTVPIPTMLHTAMTALTIGGYPPAYFNGQLDEFRVWSVARTATQITSTMNTTLTGNEANLTGYWKFDETSGTTAADSVTSAGHTAHPGMLMATTGNNPTFVVSTAPINCP